MKKLYFILSALVAAHADLPLPYGISDISENKGKYKFFGHVQKGPSEDLLKCIATFFAQPGAKDGDQKTVTSIETFVNELAEFNKIKPKEYHPALQTLVLVLEENGRPIRNKYLQKLEDTLEGKSKADEEIINATIPTAAESVLPITAIAQGIGAQNNNNNENDDKSGTTASALDAAATTQNVTNQDTDAIDIVEKDQTNDNINQETEERKDIQKVLEALRKTNMNADIYHAYNTLTKLFKSINDHVAQWHTFYKTNNQIIEENLADQIVHFLYHNDNNFLITSKVFTEYFQKAIAKLMDKMKVDDKKFTAFKLEMQEAKSTKLEKLLQKKNELTSDAEKLAKTEKIETTAWLQQINEAKNRLTSKENETSSNIADINKDEKIKALKNIRLEVESAKDAARERRRITDEAMEKFNAVNKKRDEALIKKKNEINTTSQKIMQEYDKEIGATQKALNEAEAEAQRITQEATADANKLTDETIKTKKLEEIGTTEKEAIQKAEEEASNRKKAAQEKREAASKDLETQAIDAEKNINSTEFDIASWVLKTVMDANVKASLGEQTFATATDSSMVKTATNLFSEATACSNSYKQLLDLYNAAFAKYCDEIEEEKESGKNSNRESESDNDDEQNYKKGSTGDQNDNKNGPANGNNLLNITPSATTTIMQHENNTNNNDISVSALTGDNKVKNNESTYTKDNVDDENNEPSKIIGDTPPSASNSTPLPTIGSGGLEIPKNENEEEKKHDETPKNDDGTPASSGDATANNENAVITPQLAPASGEKGTTATSITGEHITTESHSSTVVTSTNSSAEIVESVGTTTPSQTHDTSSATATSTTGEHTTTESHSSTIVTSTNSPAVIVESVGTTTPSQTHDTSSATVTTSAASTSAHTAMTTSGTHTPAQGSSSTIHTSAENTNNKSETPPSTGGGSNITTLPGGKKQHHRKRN